MTTKKSSLDFLDGTVIPTLGYLANFGLLLFWGLSGWWDLFCFFFNFFETKVVVTFLKTVYTITHCVKWGIENYSGNTVVIPRTLNRHRSSMEAHFWLHSSSVFIVFIWNHEGRAIRTQKGTHNSNRRILRPPPPPACVYMSWSKNCKKLFKMS